MQYSAPSQPARVSSRFFLGLNLAVCTLLLLLCAGKSFAGTAILAWDAVPVAGVDGYILYYGNASGNYTMSVDVGNYTTAAISGLEEGMTYYFAVAAYDVYDNESPYSNEVSYTNAVADETPPTVAIVSPVSGASVSKKSSVTINATATDSSGIAKVEFYVNGQLTCSDAVGPYTCAWQVPGAPGRTYQLQVSAYDTQGNVGASSIVTVTSR